MVLNYGEKKKKLGTCNLPKYNNNISLKMSNLTFFSVIIGSKFYHRAQSK